MQKAKVAAACRVHLYFSGYTVRNLCTGYLDYYENLPTAVLVMKAGTLQREVCILRENCTLTSH